MSDRPETPEQTLADDLLLGAEQIGKYIGATTEQTYYLFKKRKSPIGKHGKILIASKAKLNRHASKITSGS
jgi:hypothetical protein